MIVPLHAANQLRQGLGEVVLAFILEEPDELFVLLMELVQGISIDHDPQLLQVSFANVIGIHLSGKDIFNNNITRDP